MKQKNYSLLMVHPICIGIPCESRSKKQMDFKGAIHVMQKMIDKTVSDHSPDYGMYF